MNFEILVEDSDTGSPSSVTVRMEYLFAFQYWYCELCAKTRWGEGRKHCLLVFVLWLCIGPAKTVSFSKRDFSRSNKYDTFWHYRLNISTFYFHEPLLLQTFVPLKFIKTYSFPCLVSLLLSTATQITIFINIFVSNIIQYEITFFIKVHVKGFYIEISFYCETQLLFFPFFLISMVYRKSLKKNSFFL